MSTAAPAPPPAPRARPASSRPGRRARIAAMLAYPDPATAAAVFPRTTWPAVGILGARLDQPVQAAHAAQMASEEWARCTRGEWDWRNIDHTAFLLAVADTTDAHVAAVWEYYDNNEAYRRPVLPLSAATLADEVTSIVRNVYPQAVAQYPAPPPTLAAAEALALDMLRASYPPNFAAPDWVPRVPLDPGRLGRFTLENHGYGLWTFEGDVPSWHHILPRIPPPYPSAPLDTAATPAPVATTAPAAASSVVHPSPDPETTPKAGKTLPRNQQGTPRPALADTTNQLSAYAPCEDVPPHLAL